MKNAYLSFILLFVTHNLVSQADWDVNLFKDLYQINWIEQAYDGTLIVAGDKATAGVDPETGNVVWVNKDLNAVERSTFSLVDGLPYFVMKVKSIGDGESLLISSAVDGQPIMSSLDAGFTFMEYDILDDAGGILFQTKKDKRYGLAFYDLEKGEIIWKADLDKAKGGLGGFLKGQSSFLNDIVVVNDNILAVSYKKKAFGVDLNTGKVLWTNEYDKDIRKMEVGDNDTKLYLGYGKFLDVVNTTTGNSDLGETIKLRSKFASVQSHPDGIFILKEAGFNILDPNINKMKWEKPFKGSKADQALKLKNGYAFISKFDESGVITVLDNNGKKVWKKDIQGQLFYAAPLDKGILYISSNKSNVLDYEKGKKVAKKDVKIKGTPSVAFDDEANELVIFSNKTLTTINLATGQAKEIAKDIKFKKYDDEKNWAEVEPRPNGYLAYSSQNAAFISKNGKVDYNNHYKPVSTTSAMGALTQVGANIAGVDVNVNSVMANLEDIDRLSNGVYGSRAGSDGAKVETNNIASVGIGGSTLLGVVNNRFYASKADDDFLYIFMKGDKDKQIVKVNKDTGKTEKTIKLKDKSPIYHVDSYLQSVMIAEGQKVLKCYKTEK